MRNAEENGHLKIKYKFFKKDGLSTPGFGMWSMPYSKLLSTAYTGLKWR